MQTKIIIYIIIGILVVAGIAGASWYFAIRQPVEAPPVVEPVLPLEEVPPEVEVPKEKIPIPDKATILKIIDEVIPIGFDKARAEYKIDDLNEDGYPEIIVGAFYYRPSDTPERYYYFNKPRYFGIITILDKDGNYKKIGELNAPLLPENEAAVAIVNFEEFRDIDDDGKKEIIVVHLGDAGGIAPYDIIGILYFDITKQRLDWAKFKNREEKVINRFFGVTARAGWGYFPIIRDLDRDGRGEIVSVNWTLGDPPVSYTYKAEEVYEWDGALFAFNQEIQEAYDKCFTEKECAKTILGEAAIE